MNLCDINSNPHNPRLIKDDRFKKLTQSIKDFPKMMALRPMVVDENNIVLGGNMRLKALRELGFKEIPDEWVKKASDLTDEEIKRFIIVDNVGFGENDWEMLANGWDMEELSDWGLELPGFITSKEEAGRKLQERFIVPPFSVLDTKQGYWQERKKAWLGIGIKSEIGRSEVMASLASANKVQGSEMPLVSIFDPVLCEIIYQWFNTTNGIIVDPFAGGSVRGIVAARLGYEYVGVDLRSEQIEANRINAKEVLNGSTTYPQWHCGNSLQIDEIVTRLKADLIFSCPPYHDLEVYSDNKEDLSNMPYDEFINQYRQIIQKSVALLKDDRFACFVVSDIRDKKGFYKNFVAETIAAFHDAGAILYNEIILVNAVGSLAVRAGRQFNNGRKVGKQHQNVLVFYKGNPKNIKQNYPELDLSGLEEVENEVLS